MSLTTIYTALANSLVATQIDLYEAALSQPALNPLLGVLNLYGIRSTYLVNNALLLQDLSSVTLNGNATFGVPGAASENISAVRVSLLCTSPNNNDRFVLSLAITTPNWTFSSTFPVLPDCKAFNEEDQSVKFVPSFLYNLPFNKPVFSASSEPEQMLQLAGELPLSSTFTPYADFFGPWPLRTSGTIILPASATQAPDIHLFALAPTHTLQIGAIALREMGLQLTVVTDLDELENLVSELSILSVAGTIYLGQTTPIPARLSMPLLGSDDYWRLLIEFEPGVVPLSEGLAEVAALFGIPVAALPLPANFIDFAGFYFSEIDLGFYPSTTGAVTIEHIAVSLASNKSWLPGIPFVDITNVGTRWLMGWSSGVQISPEYISGCVYGDVVIGTPPPLEIASANKTENTLISNDEATATSFTINVTSYIPSYGIVAQLRTDDTIPIGAAFQYFFGNPGPQTRPGMEITEFRFEADPLTQTYQANASMTLDWTIPLGANVALTLQELFFNIQVTQGAVTGGITGQFTLVGGGQDADSDPIFNVGAQYTENDAVSGWVFSGVLYPGNPVSLLSLVSNFLGITPPTSLPDVFIERLVIRFATGSQAYALAGTVVGRWTLAPFGTSLNISALAMADIVQVAGTSQPEGSLVGRFSLNKFAVEVGMNLSVNEPTYLFKVEFDSLWLTATTGWHGATDQRHQALSIQLGGVTLGDILEYLVNLAAPTPGFRLDPPWDVLKRIDLSRFVLTIDPSENTVALTYAVNVDLIFMQIETIGVRYSSIQGEPAVELLLTGRFLNKVYTNDNPLGWDVIADSPPAVPGEGNALLELRYLGLGQHVALQGTTPDTVYETLVLLSESMQPPVNPHINPLQQSSGSGMSFAADSSWLIGIDVSLLETLDLGIIFNDPRLYGLVIGLNGERAGSLAGLRFEVLYKKISNDIGLFRVELRMPEMFRHIELGPASITLGVVVVEIYTNGNFLVDLGFPYNRNYERSFALQIFPFIGRGGIYFGLLNGQTSRRVPAITNGTFDPVLELGIGLALGVGKEISSGALSGGIAVEVEVIFQGVLAWFNSTSSGVAPAKYYWGQGIAAISGKLYGKIDFKLIKVSVTLEAYAQASVIFEAYRATIFRLAVGVRARAEVELLFVSVSFSFSVTLSVSFTLGSDQSTPWLLAGGQGTSTQARLRTNILPGLGHDPVRLAQRLRLQHLLELRRAPSGASLSVSSSNTPNQDTSDILNWNPATRVFTDSPRQVPTTMLPAFSITQLPINWDGTQPPNINPQHRISFLLFAPNGVPARTPSIAATTVRSSQLSAHATSTSELSSDILIEAFLRWAISSVTGSPGNDPSSTITAGQIQLLLEQMQSSATADDGFSSTNLSAFFLTNLWLELSGDPGGDPSTIGGMAFPLPPFLSWTSPQAGSRDFAVENPVGPLYEWGVSTYLEQYFPLPEAAEAQPVDDPATYESFSSYIFRDWCLLLAREAVQAASDTLASWVVAVTGPTSLRTVAASFPTVSVDYTVRAGDTVDSVALVLGATPDELIFLNPQLSNQLALASAGQTIQILLGIAPQNVAVDTATVTLASDVPLNLGTLTYQIALGDTLSGIAARFHLSGPLELFADPTLATNPQILRMGAVFQVPQLVYAPPSTFSTLLIAGAFYVRYFNSPAYGPQNIPFAGWYAQTVFDWNANGALLNFSYDQPLPAGLSLNVPPAFNETNPANAILYTTLPGDTLLRLGAALALAQNFGTGTGPDENWPAFRDQVQPVTGGFSLPTSTVTILSGETINLLAARTIVYATDLAGLLDWIDEVTILSSLASLSIPGANGSTAVDGTTLEALASHFGLTIEELASLIADVPIFTGTPEYPLDLTVTNIPVQSTDMLVQQVLAGPAPAQISGASSRYLLAGLRLPAPEDSGDGHIAATGSLTSLYDLTAQQFAGPSPDLTQPETIALQVMITVNAGIDWIQLLASTTVSENETFAALAARVPCLQDLNRGLANPVRLRSGMIVLTDPVNELVFSYTNQQLQTYYPATGLALAPQRGPALLPLAGQVPLTYGLDHRIELQAPLALPIPLSGTIPLTGNPSLWPFSDALLERALATSTTPYDIIQTSNQSANTAQPETLNNSTFATLLPFTARRLDGSSRVYELSGANTVNRQLLLALWQYLSNPQTPPGSQAFLLLAPTPDASNISGLTVLATDLTSTFLVKTNETTESTPEVAAATTSQYYANLSELAQFVLLLWEGSVVNGTGYYLGFADINGQDLPAGAFDERGNVGLYLLVIAGEQQALVPTGRSLLTFNNCALLAPGLDPSASALFIEAADDSELLTVATVQPGNIGLALTLPLPQQPAEGLSPEIQLQQLFSLLTFEASAPFALPQAGFPVLPQATDEQQLPLWQRQRQARWRRAGRQVGSDVLDEQYWLYEQVLPIARFGPPSIVPEVAGLPDPIQDPYRGIGGQSLSSTIIQTGFADILGNVTVPSSTEDDDQVPPGGFSAPVGYTDPLLGVANWPALTTSYTITSGADTVTLLTVTLTTQPGAITPVAGQNPALALDLAANQAAKYSQVYYQLAQPGVSAWLLSSLQQDSTGQAVPLVLDEGALWRFVAANYVSATAAAGVSLSLASGSLSTITQTCGLSYADLAAANASEPIVQLFSTQPVDVPAYVIFSAGDSATSILALPRPGWPVPSNGAALLAMPENATLLPLRQGVILSQPAISLLVPSDSIPTLTQFAALYGTSSALLAVDNANASGILQQGFVFVMDGLTVTVGLQPDLTTVDTFADVHQAFAELGVNVSLEDIAVANDDEDHMLVGNSTLTSLHYIAQAFETLAQNGSGISVTDLAANNADTTNLFDAGALLYLGAFTPTPVLAPDETATLLEFAERYACPLSLLLEANAELVLPADTTFVVPGTVTLPVENDLHAPYTILPGDTLDAITGKFAPAPGTETPAVNLAAANLTLPGTIAGGQIITVVVDGSTCSTPTEPGDSFQTVLQRLQVQLATITLIDLVEAIESTAGYLAADGLLVCPLAMLPSSDNQGGPTTPNLVALTYGVDASAFAQSNAGLLGLIIGNVTLSLTTASASIVTGTNDTFNSLVSRFAAQGVQTDIPTIVSANLDQAFLKAGALTLLSPAPLKLSVSLGTNAGPFATPIFPLTVQLRIQRPEEVIDPAFHTAGPTGPVECVDASIPAPASSQGQGDEASLTLSAFAQAFQTALPDLRLATGKVAGVFADLWVVDFGNEGIAQVSITPGVPMPDNQRWPRFFALRPLYNDLVTRLGVQIHQLQPDGLLSPSATSTDYQGIDVEVWARRFLADMDLFLSAPYSAALYANQAARGSLDIVLDAKQTLSEAIARGIAPVLALSDPNLLAGQAAAIASLEQQLAVNLARAYSTDSLVQYDTAVISAWTQGVPLKPARLVGSANALPLTDLQTGTSGESLPVSVAGAKTLLDQPESFVTFLLSVADPSHSGNLAVQLDYGFPNLEFHISQVAGINGYEASDWLAFVPPLLDTNIPACIQIQMDPTNVPIPLRFYPAAPVLLGQIARATLAASPESRPPSLAQTPLWTYGLTYTHEHAAQDEVLVTATFNLPPVPVAQASEPDDIARALAGYLAVADDLWALLSGFVDPVDGNDPTTLANAATTFSTLASDIASQWDLRWPVSSEAIAQENNLPESQERYVPGTGTSPAQQSYRFRVRLGYRYDDTGNAFFDTLQLSSEQSQPGPVNQWPVTFCLSPDGRQVPLIPGQPINGTLIYQFPSEPAIPADQWPHLTIEWTGLNVAASQNARAALAVRRNQKLLGDTSPDTTADFLYQTPTIEAADIVTPLNTWPERIDITSLGTDVSAALQAVFQTLFGETVGLPLTTGMLYGYELIPPSATDTEGLITYLPVSLYPNQQLSANTATNIATALSNWYVSNLPAPDGGEWAFSLTLYSQLDNSARHPLLSLERLIYRIAPGENLRGDASAGRSQ